jgi:urease accessory protein
MSTMAGDATDGVSDGLALLRLLQLSDSQFPVGAFAHSAGLEAYAQDGIGPDDLHELMATQLELGWGRLDLAGWVRAWHAPGVEALDALGREMSAWKPIPGVRAASLSIGARTARLAARLWPDWEDLRTLEHPHQAIVSGALARCAGVRPVAGALAFAQSTLTAQLAAATRCMPLSPERGQEILTALAPQLLEAVTRAVDDPVGHFWSATPEADLAAHRQASLRTRLFQS